MTWRPPSGTFFDFVLTILVLVPFGALVALRAAAAVRSFAFTAAVERHTSVGEIAAHAPAWALLTLDAHLVRCAAVVVVEAVARQTPIARPSLPALRRLTPSKMAGYGPSAAVYASIVYSVAVFTATELAALPKPRRISTNTLSRSAGLPRTTSSLDSGATCASPRVAGVTVLMKSFLYWRVSELDSGDA